MYNKRKFHKANDKKVLHKIKKQWITISLALFMMIGGGAIATHVNADTKINTHTPAIKVSKTQLFNVNNTKAIQTKARVLHANIIRLGATSNNQTIQTGIYDGMNYKYNPNTKSLIFINGTLQKSHYNSYGNEDYKNFLYKAPSTLNHATSIKFDNGVKVSNHISDMSSMFSDNTYLRSLTLPDSFNTSNINNMDNMFSRDINLRSLTLPNNFDTHNVSDMARMFSHDTNLRSLTLPNNFDTHNVSDMTHMFSHDTNLRSLTLPESFSTYRASDTSVGLFNHDTHLRSLTLPKKFNLIGSDSDTFSGDRFLTYLHISSPDTTFNNLSGLKNKWRKVGTHHLVNLANGKGNHVGTWIQTDKPIISKKVKRIRRIRKRRIQRTGRKLLKLANRDKKVLASKHAKHFNRLIKQIHSKYTKKLTKRALLRKIHRRTNRKYLNVYKNLRKTNKLLYKGVSLLSKY